MKRTLWMLGLALLLILGAAVQPTAWAAEEPAVEETVNLAELQANMEKTAQAIQQKGQISEWGAVGFGRLHMELPRTYSETLLKEVVEERGQFRLVTELERKIIGLAASGIDAGDVLGYSLIDELLNHSNMTGQGANGVIYALIALQSSGYEQISSGSWSTQLLIDWLLKEQNEDGGWSLYTDAASDIDITGMALTALSPYRSQADVKTSVDRGAAWILEGLKAGTATASISSESISQAMIGLASIGQSPHSLYEQLLQYRLETGEFSHRTGEQANAMATEQALLAMTAYYLYEQGLPGLYEGLNGVYAEVIVEGPDSSIAAGQVHAAQALEAVQELLLTEGIPLQIESSSYGRYITAINGIEQGQYGGWDGWNYAVYRNHAWVPASEYGAMDAFELQEGDRLFVYYNNETQLVESIQIDPLAARAEEPFELKVSKSVWDWDNGQAEVTPASNVTVHMGEQTILTDENGIASVKGVAAGKYEVKVTDYDNEQGARIVPFYYTLHVQPAEASVFVRVEGMNSTISEGKVNATNALQAAERLLETKQIAYDVKDSSFGQYITSIGDIEQGYYGGYDGWNYGIKRQGEWLPASSYGAMAEFELQQEDELVVYYNHQTQVIDELILEPSTPRSGEPLRIKVTQSTWDYESNEDVVTPASGASVTLGGETALTNEEGIAIFERAPAGTHDLTVTSYTDQGPKVVKDSRSVTVVPSSAAEFSDQALISKWAFGAVEQAVQHGYVYGVSGEGLLFAPKQLLSRAEFVSLLNRVLHIQAAYAADLPFEDVPEEAWYSGDVAAAIKAGYLIPEEAKFEGAKPITRAEMAQLIMRALDIPSTTGLQQFEDLQDVSYEYIPYIETAAERQLLVGSDGKFMPHDQVTREMASAVILRVNDIAAERP